MSTTHTRVESGLRDQRLEFIRENQLGVVPTDPTYIEYANTVQNFAWTPEAEPQGRRAIGSEDVITWEQGPEIHELTVTYDLVRWFDDSANPNDASADAMFRGPDGLLSSHTVVAREEKGSIHANNTVNGSTSKATRIYTVAHGAVPSEVEIQGDPSDAFPVQIALTYRAQEARSYQIDQPDSSSFIHVESDSANDTMDITLEEEDAHDTGQGETLTLSGTTAVATSTEFTDLDAAYLAEEPEGTVTIYADDGSGSGSAGAPADALMEIHGQSEYGDLIGDQGVPAIENGTRDTAPDQEPETFIGASIDRGGTELRHEIPSAVLRVTNELEELERATDRPMGVYAGNRTVEMDCTMYGETTTHDLFDEYLRTVEDNINWNLATGTLTVENAVYFEPGERAIETAQAIMEVDSTFQGQGLQVDQI